MAAALVACGGSDDAPQAKLETVAQWDRIQYDLGDATAEKAYNDNQTYKKVLAQGVQVDAQGNMYVSTARWGGADVPATLSKLVKQADGSFKLQPYPSKAMNDVTNPAGLKAVLGFAIDRNNIMWMLDQGHVDGVATSSSDEKLIGWDIINNVEKYRIEFADTLYDKTCSFLNDVAVDNDNGFVYITDSGIRCDPLKGALMVYDYKNNQIRRILDGDTLTQDEPNFAFSIHGRSVLKNGAMRTGADGIALSGDKATLYWTNLTGNNLYSVPTALLRDLTTPVSTIKAAVKGEALDFNTDGMTADRAGNIYLTALTKNGVYKRDAATGVIAPLFTSDDIAWADTLAWGPDGSLYALSNHLHLWVDGDMNFATPNAVANFRIYRWTGTVGAKPYTAQ
ncbi:MAG: L-dopachrome tautomerase-related protein [Caldimonas sp.]